MAEVFPPLFENRVFPWHLIPGKYNIGKWLRPIDFTIEYKVPKGKIKIKRGEPLFYIHFSTATHETFELERVHQTEGMQHQVGACVSLKDHVMKLKPEETYKMFEECPVKHYHKWFEGKDESIQKHQQPTKEGYQPLEEKEHDKS
jgi:hypothetical protein